MPHFVTSKCLRCKYTDCVEVCPVECFYEAKNMLVIHPDECIDCGVCIAECPIGAIACDVDIEDVLKLPNEKLNDSQRSLIKFRDINAKLAQFLPSIKMCKKPLPDAELYAKEEIKDQYYDEEEELSVVKKEQ